MVTVSYGPSTHLRAPLAVVSRASIVLSPSTESAIATRTGYGLRSRIAYSRPLRASTYQRPSWAYGVCGTPCTRISTFGGVSGSRDAAPDPGVASARSAAAEQAR